jgi:uroporphyrinogen decarboxylase
MTPNSHPREPDTAVPTKLLLRALAGESLKRPPFWLMRQAGRYLPEYREIRGKSANFLDFCYSPSLAAEATLQPVKRFATDGAIVFSDILVIPDALGQKVEFIAGRGPVLEPLGQASEIDLDLDGLREFLSPVYKTLSKVRAELAEEVALIGFAGAPWTLACYMVEGGPSPDFATLRAWIYERREETQDLIDLLVEAVSAHLIAQVEAGADVLQLFDSWAGILPEREFDRWSITPTAKIVGKVKEACPGVPIIGFPNRSGFLYKDYAARTGVDAVSIDASVPLDWAARELQGRCAVQGNLDPHLLLAGGEALSQEVERILSVLGGGRFIFNLGHGVLPKTPPAHVATVADLVRAWGS